MIAALSLSLDGQETVFLTGDSRVTFYTESGKLEAFNDMGQKVFNITENVFVGFAGDFLNIHRLIDKLKKKLIRPMFGKPVIFSRAELIVKEISKVLKGEWNEKFASSSLFIVIRDFNDKRVKLFQIDSPIFEYKILKQGLYLIGGDDVDRIKFYQSYKTHYEYINPLTIEQHSVPIFSAFQEISNTEINGLNPCYLIQIARWITLNHAFSDDGGENWVADAGRDEGQWERQVNGKQIKTTNTNYDEVMDDRNKIRRK